LPAPRPQAKANGPACHIDGATAGATGEILREIIKKHPDSPEAAEAEELPADLGPQAP